MFNYKIMQYRQLLHRFYFGLCFIFCLAHLSFAQSRNCYSGQRNDGIKDHNERRYNNAINNFFAALACEDCPVENDIIDLIKKSQKAIENELTEKRDDAIAAEKEARKSLVLAEKAQKAEAIARAEAENNAQVAREKGIQAEMLRLALLADNQRISNNPTDALLLAYLSMKLAGDRSTPGLIRSFAQAVWDTLKQPIATTNLPLKAIFPVADGQEWLGVLADQSLVLLRDGKMLPFNTGSEQASFDGAMASSGGKLLAGTTSGKAWLWAPGANAALPVNAHPEAILATSASLDGKYWLTASRDNNARLWSAEGSLLRTFEGHTGNVYGAIFSPDGQTMLTRSSDGSLRLWSISSGSATLLPNPPLYSYDVLFSVSGSKILAAGHDGKLYRWDSRGNSLQALALHRGPIRQLTLSPNQQYILTEGIDSTLTLLSPEGELLAKFDDPTIPIHISGIDPQGQHLALGVKDHSIRLYNFESRETQVLRGHQAEIIGLAFSSDGKSLLSTAKDGMVRLWDLHGNLLLEVKLGNTSVPIAATFSPDGKKIIAASNDNQTLLECPTPEAAMAILTRQAASLLPKIEQLKQNYNIQFVE